MEMEEKFDFNLGREIVYSTDVHPDEPWILIATFSEGENAAYVRVVDFQTLDVVFNVELVVAFQRIWCSKFFKHQPWIVSVDEFGNLHFYNYDTMQAVGNVFASSTRVCVHDGRMNSVAVHPTHNCVLSSSVDYSIKLWVWDGAVWGLMQVFEDHSHSVMQVVFNPDNPNMFATASLDGCMKVWTIGSSEPNFTCRHMGCVNCVAFINGRILTGSADGTAKVWQENGQLVRSLDCNYSVSTVCYHSELGVIITGSEEGALIWDSTTFNPINTCVLARNVLTVSSIRSKRWVIGGESGAILVKVTRRPVTFMDKRSRIFWYRNKRSRIFSYKNDKIQLYDPVEAQVVQNGGNVDITMTGVISCGLIPRDLKISPDEGFLAVCDVDRFIILSRVNDSIVHSGSALDFVWLSESVFAVKESTSVICFYELSTKRRFFGLATHDNVEKIHSIDAPIPVERIFGGTFFSICYNEVFEFYDPVDFKFIQNIDVNVKHLYWADKGGLFAIVGHDNSVHIFKFKQGIAYDHAFEQLFRWSASGRVKRGIWVEDLFICIDSQPDSQPDSWQLKCCGADGVFGLADLLVDSYIVGYHPRQNGEYIYIADRSFSVTGYNLLPHEFYAYWELVTNNAQGAEEARALIPEHVRNLSAHFLELADLHEGSYIVGHHPTQNGEYVYIVDGNLKVTGYNLLPPEIYAYWELVKNNAQGKKEARALIPEHVRNLSAHFLARHGNAEEAMVVAKDHGYRYEFAMQLGNLEVAEECKFWMKDDFGSLFELYTSRKDNEGLRQVASRAKKLGDVKVACYILSELEEYEECYQLLRQSKMKLEAKMMARCYDIEPAPSEDDDGLQDDEGQQGEGEEGIGVGVDDAVMGFPLAFGVPIGIPVAAGGFDAVIGVPAYIDTGQGDAPS